jgi:two-component system C4-dicarboxylate transport sensor histidine kinase DctB
LSTTKIPGKNAVLGRELTKKERGLIGFSFFTIILILLLNAVSAWTYRLGIIELRDKGMIRLELYINFLQGVLEKYESLPELLAIDNNLVKALLNPHEKKRIETLNRYLETINTVSDTSDTYLMNRDGLTIAASNWNEEHPFIGRNFSFRPYFKQAMKGQLGRYFALGTTSSKRGYYFAYPVRKDKEILGAVAIKINIDLIEEKWAYHDEHFLVTDPDGVVFITTNPDWRFNTLTPLAPEAARRITESRRYPETEFHNLSKRVDQITRDVQVLTISDRNSDQVLRVVKQSQFMPEAGWNVHLLTDTRGLRKRVLITNMVVGSMILLLYVLILLFIQRKNRLAQIGKIEENAKKALREANERLETRVAERTLELTNINKLLRKEILERKQTENKLNKTRKELIHAAKLAVLGQMSAGINHELNQPLAAIRSYTDNGKKFLEKGRLEEARWNLEQIGELTERMAQIGVQLKLFSRKSGDQITPVPLHNVIDGALEILKPTIEKAGVALHLEVHPDDLEVKGNEVLLQQVLVNLISNAIQSLEATANKKIEVVCSENGDLVTMVVQDNGPGISDDLKTSIFEPFFTTKKSGLGLGLAITERIIKDLGGEISLADTGGGARFVITLLRAR